jgi:hypothetical protein
MPYVIEIIEKDLFKATKLTLNIEKIGNHNLFLDSKGKEKRYNILLTNKG